MFWKEFCPGKVAAAATLLIALAPASASAEPQARIYNDKLRAIFASPEATLRERRRSPMVFDSGRVVWNCADFLEEAGRSRLAWSTDNDRERYQYAICDFLGVLKDADWSTPPADNIPSYGKALAERLDLRTFPSSIGPRVSDRHYLPIHEWGDATKASKYVAEAELSDWYYRLEVAAEADIDHDGRSDWIVWWVDDAQGPTYLFVGILIVSNPAATGLLAASPVER